MKKNVNIDNNRINDLIESWKAEEKIAHIHGWDFSHIHGRYTEEIDLPWDYKEVVKKYVKDTDKILDIDTGGGEFLLSLNHPHNLTAATEGFEPNIKLCKETLPPLEIDFRAAKDVSKLPFVDGEFDVVINRHGSFDSKEINRVLKKGGIFITQQVGENNDRELVELLMPGTPKPFSDLNLEEQKRNFESAGFSILHGEETYRPIRFFDVGALVWFARIIEWEFPDFSVDTHIEGLLHAQEILDKKGSIDGIIHRYLLVVKKL